MEPATQNETHISMYILVDTNYEAVEIQGVEAPN